MSRGFASVHAQQLVKQTASGVDQSFCENFLSSLSVRICLLLLLLLLIGVGVFLLLKYSSDEVRPKSLTVIPPPEQGGLIHFVASDRESVRNITRQIEAALLREWNLCDKNLT